MTLLTDLEDFLHAHRSHRPLTADATEPAWNGYLLPVMAYPCGVVFGRWVTPEDSDAEPFRLALLNWSREEPAAQGLILSPSVRGSSTHKYSLPSAAGAAQRSNSGQDSSILGGSAAVVQTRSINTLPSTTSPTNTTRQTMSRPSSKGARRRSLPSEPRATRSRWRVSEFHTRSLCRMDIVLSTRNVPCPQTRPSDMSRLTCIYRAEAVDSKIPADEATARATVGHLARRNLWRWGHFGAARRAGHTASHGCGVPRSEMVCWGVMPSAMLWHPTVSRVERGADDLISANLGVLEH